MYDYYFVQTAYFMPYCLKNKTKNNIGLDTMILFTKEVLYKLKIKNFKASLLSTYDFSTLYTMLPHQLIQDKLIDFINQAFIRENTQYLVCNKECVGFFSLLMYTKNYNLWSCQKVCDALVYLLDIIFIRFGTKLYRQTIGIPMGTSCCRFVSWSGPPLPKAHLGAIDSTNIRKKTSPISEDAHANLGHVRD